MQWHPFSFSSSPTEPNFISFHIAPVGDWTKKLKDIALECKKEKKPFPTVKVMGPFGAPA